MTTILNALMTLIMLVSSITSSASDAANLATATAIQALESVKSDNSVVIIETDIAEDIQLVPSNDITPTVDPADDMDDEIVDCPEEDPDWIEIEEEDVPLAGWPIEDEADDETETSDDTAGNETEMPSEEIQVPEVPGFGPALPPPTEEPEYPNYVLKIDPPLPCCTTVEFNGDGTVTLTNTHGGGFYQTTCSEIDYYDGNFHW